MAKPQRFDYTWHVGETATPFQLPFVNSDGTPRTDVTSATFTLINRDTGTVLINAAACGSVANGLLTYYPSALEMATACRFLAQFTITITVEGLPLILPSVKLEGEIEANL